MARKRFSDEDVVRLMRQIEVETASDLTLDKLILKESLDYLKPKA